MEIGHKCHSSHFAYNIVYLYFTHFSIHCHKGMEDCVYHVSYHLWCSSVEPFLSYLPETLYIRYIWVVVYVLESPSYISIHEAMVERHYLNGFTLYKHVSNKTIYLSWWKSVCCGRVPTILLVCTGLEEFFTHWWYISSRFKTQFQFKTISFSHKC